MNDFRHLLSEKLQGSEVDLLEIVSVPTHGDKMVRLRTLEEALEDFDATHERDNDGGAETVSYLIQVKKSSKAKKKKASSMVAAPSSAVSAQELQGAAAVAAAVQSSGIARVAQPWVETSLPPQPAKPSAATASPLTGENIYQQDGKLNVNYLARNADTLLSAGDFSLARNIYKAIAASGSRTALAQFGMGRCEEAEGRLEEARAHYEEAIAYHPTLEGYQRLSGVLMSQKKEKLAAETLECALNLREIDEPTRYELHKAAGNCWTRARAAESAEAAERHFRNALEIDPSADEICGNLGALYLSSHRLDDARRSFNDALVVNPDNARAVAGLASCDLAAGDKRAAHDGFARALDLDINNPAAIYHLVKCAYDIRSYAAAARLVEEYIQVAPVNTSLLFSLAGLQFHLGRPDDARSTSLRILELNAEHPGAKELIRLLDRSSQ
jgi:tetratricopeptide (TPR) repeat protein